MRKVNDWAREWSCSSLGVSGINAKDLFLIAKSKKKVFQFLGVVTHAAVLEIYLGKGENNLNRVNKNKRSKILLKQYSEASKMKNLTFGF